MEMFTDSHRYHWFVFGLILLGAEALGAAGFLLGAGVGALATGPGAGSLPDMAASLQLVLYRHRRNLATYLYFQVFRRCQDDRGVPPINQRAAALVGHPFRAGPPHRERRRQGADRRHLLAGVQPRLTLRGARVEVVRAQNMSLRACAGE